MPFWQVMKAMNIIEQVTSYISYHGMIQPGETVLAAVSGGADSVALLHMLKALRKKLNINIHVAHLDHMFRGEESQQDAEFVAALCRGWNVPYTIEAVNVSDYKVRQRLSNQVAAREVRYRFLEQVAQSQNCHRIALGHHADDQAETVILNLLRGTGPTGLAGISPIRDGRYIRPLLGIRRSDIELYCQENSLPYRNDSSNCKTEYLRNRVRIQLLPQLEEQYNPEIVDALIRLADICRAEDKFIEEQTNALYQTLITDEKDKIIINSKELSKVDLALRRRVLRQVYRQATGGKRELSFFHVELLIKQACSVNPIVIELPGDINCSIHYNKMIFHRRKVNIESPNYCYRLNVPGKTIINEVGYCITAELLTSCENPATLPEREAVLDYGLTGQELFVRPRRPGDIFKPQGVKGKVKLKKFLIDQKVPRGMRNYIPLICNKQEIIWVGGLRVGEYWKVTKDSKIILHLKLEKLTQ